MHFVKISTLCTKLLIKNLHNVFPFVRECLISVYTVMINLAHTFKQRNQNCFVRSISVLATM